MQITENRAGAIIGDAFASLMDEEKKRADDAKYTRAMAGVMVKAGKLGITQADVHELPSPALKGMMDAYHRESDEQTKLLARTVMEQDVELKKHQNAMAIMSQMNSARMPAFLQRVSELDTPPEDVPALPSPMSNEEFSRRTAPLSFRTIAEAGAATGYNPRLQDFDDILRAETARKGAMNFDWEAMKPREGVTSGGAPYIYGHGGQFQFTPLPPTGKPAKRISPAEAPKVDGYDIIPTDQGGFRYASKPKEKPAVDLNQFDANQDGVLTGDEVSKAIMAQAMVKNGMPYEGMKTGGAASGGGGVAPTPTKAGGSLYDQYKAWRGTAK